MTELSNMDEELLKDNFEAFVPTCAKKHPISRLQRCCTVDAGPARQGRNRQDAKHTESETLGHLCRFQGTVEEVANLAFFLWRLWRISLGEDVYCKRKRGRKVLVLPPSS